jgi:DNA-binding transcriptional regulator YhcF (GntR family)
MLWQLDTGSTTPLTVQLAGCVRRALADGEISAGDRLPPAAELSEAVGVDRNTVLAAYRQLRDEGVLEFRRGRGVRVAAEAKSQAVIDDALAKLLKLAGDNGYSRAELVRMIEEK